MTASVPYHIPAPIPHYALYDREWLDGRIKNILDTRLFTRGENVHQLREKLEGLTGYAHAIPFSSCSQAILILARWYAKKGFRTIRCPAYTWHSTYHPFYWLGYRVEFVDIDRKTWLADFGDTVPDVDTLTVPVDNFGSVYPTEGLHKERTFIDSAQSLGAKWDSTEFTRTISLSGSKLATTGEGGAILTQDDELSKFAEETGQWFSRMPELSAALGLSYLSLLPKIRRAKENLFQEYERKLNGKVEWQEIPIDTNRYVIAGLCDTKKIRKANPDWEFKDYYQNFVGPNDTYGSMAAIPGSSLPNTRYIARNILALPSWSELPLETVREMGSGTK